MKRSLRKRELIILLLAVIVPAALGVGVVLLSNGTADSQFVGMANYLRLFLKDSVFRTALRNTLLVPAVSAIIIGAAVLAVKRWLRGKVSSLSDGWYDLIVYAVLFLVNLIVWILTVYWRQSQIGEYPMTHYAAHTIVSHLTDYSEPRIGVWLSVSQTMALLCGSSLLVLIVFGVERLVDGVQRLRKRKTKKQNG